ncbi:MAG: DUF2891 family protein [Taibaiella sp.]|nr:DUF2891 family protein [Taibaiella sp.]
MATPAYLEPDGSDFFSPSLCIADLMKAGYYTEMNSPNGWKNFIQKRALQGSVKYRT